MPAKLPNPGQALGDYLDEMLHQATTGRADKPLIDRRDCVPLPGELLEVAPGLSENAGLEEETETQITPDATAEINRVATGEASEFPMQCLMFRVGGHLLSIPLIQLGCVVHWTGSITRLPESAEWLLGLVKHRESNLRVVDTRLLLNIEQETADRTEHLLVLDDSDWAITCDQLEQVVNLDYDDIQWRAAMSHQLVMGTIRASLSTLLNPAGIIYLLNQRSSTPIEV